MSDYISRSWLLKNTNTGMGVIELMQAIIDAPAADVRQVGRGKWGTDRFKMERMICSECGVVLEWSKINNFCPNCGADMRQTGDENV